MEIVFTVIVVLNGIGNDLYRRIIAENHVTGSVDDCSTKGQTIGMIDRIDGGYRITLVPLRPPLN